MNYESGIRNKGLNWLKLFFNSLILASLFLIPATAQAGCCIFSCLEADTADNCSRVDEWRAEPCSEVQPCTQVSEEQAAGRGLGGALDLLGVTSSGAGFPTAADEPEVVVGRIVQGLLLVIGVVFGVLVIYGGYLWMIARGNEEYVKKAIGILQAAVIGFVIVLGAYAITSYIVERVILAAYQQDVEEADVEEAP